MLTITGPVQPVRETLGMGLICYRPVQSALPYLGVAEASRHRQVCLHWQAQHQVGGEGGCGQGADTRL